MYERTSGITAAGVCGQDVCVTALVPVANSINTDSGSLAAVPRWSFGNGSAV
jgi:hypothetical protein